MLTQYEKKFKMYFFSLWFSGNPLGENFQILYCSYINVENIQKNRSSSFQSDFSLNFEQNQYVHFSIVCFHLVFV